MHASTPFRPPVSRIGRTIGQLTPRLLLITCILLGLTAAAPAASRARTAQPTAPLASSASSLLSPTDGSDDAAPVTVGGIARRAALASEGYTSGHAIRLRELDRLIHSPQGRSLLRGSLGVAVLHALERGYGVSPDSVVMPPADPAARPAAPATIPAYHLTRSVEPTLTLQATGVPAGSRIGLAGARFVPGETVTLLLDGQRVGALIATARGALPRGGIVTLPILVAAGTHTLAAVGSRSPQWATAPLRVYGVTASLQRAASGTAILFRERGFAPGRVVRFVLQTPAGLAVLLGLGGTDSEGALVPLRLFVPPAARAGHSAIVVRDDAGEEASLPLTLVASARGRQVISVYRLVARRHARVIRRTTLPTPGPTPGQATARHGSTHAAGVTARMVGSARGAAAVGFAGGHVPFSAELTAPAALPADNCYSQMEAGFTFTSMNCPVTSTGSMTATVANVTVTPPSALGVTTTIILPSITVDSSNNNQPVLPITLPNFSFTEANFTVSAISSTIATTGLTVASASLTLPDAFGGASLTASNISIGTDGSRAGSVTLTPDPLTISYAGFSLTLSGVSLDKNGVSVGSVTLAIPPDILPSVVPAGVPTSVTVNNVHLTVDGGFSVGSVTTGAPG